jgi:hypothetical protein
MRILIAVILCLTSTLAQAQVHKPGTRIIKGYVFDALMNSKAVGTNVLQYKTANGAVVGADGTFELTVAAEDTVLVHIPFCFNSYFIEYLPSENYKKIVLNRKLERRSQRILQRIIKKEKRANGGN